MELKKIIALFAFLIIFSSVFSAGNKSYGSESLKGETALNITIDTKDLTGVNLWIVDLYNNDRTLYAIVVTLVMAILGSVLAFGTDLILKYFGMSVSRISHSE